MTRIGLISDTHNAVARTRVAVELLAAAGADVLVHCGDLTGPEIVKVCSALPLYFVFGNNDAESVPDLRAAAERCGATCLGWGGTFERHGRRLAIVHGHRHRDTRPLLQTSPDYLFSGHSHQAADWMEGATRRINPGALFRAKLYTVAMLDLQTDRLQVIHVPR